NVRACVELLAAYLLRRHIGERPYRYARSSELLVAGRDRRHRGQVRRSARRCKLCQTEIEDLRPAARGDKNVGRLDVAVNDAFRVRGIESVGDLDAQFEHSV